MKVGKLAIRPWLSCQYTENTLMDLLSSVTPATANSTTLSELRGYCITNGDLLLHSILIFCQRTWMQRATIWNPRGSLREPSCTRCHTQLVWGSSLQITATNPRFVQGKISWSIAYWKQFQLEYLPTLESEINVPLCLLFFGIFSRGYGLITDLKDLNSAT